MDSMSETWIFEEGYELNKSQSYWAPGEPDKVGKQITRQMVFDKKARIFTCCKNIKIPNLFFVTSPTICTKKIHGLS